MAAPDAMAEQIEMSIPPEPWGLRSFQEVVREVATRAKTALPDAEERVDTAAALVLAGEVELLDGGRTARVVSQSDGGTAYVVNGQCPCHDFPTAPGNFCTHRLAYGIAKRATSLVQERVPPLTAQGGPAVWEPPDSLAVAPGIAAGGEDSGDDVPAPGTREATSLPDVLEIPVHYLQTIDGKPFVKYAGLLAMAHDRGLQRLEARFTRVSDTLAVAHATATFADGRRFTESGDATPENVGWQVRPHFARLALTRAKARCLRDALNIGLCAVEELGG